MPLLKIIAGAIVVAILLTGCRSPEPKKPAPKVVGRILGYGVFGTTAAVRDQQTTNGIERVSFRAPQLRVSTDRIEPIVGLRFGIVFAVEGLPEGEEANLSLLLEHPRIPGTTRRCVARNLKSAVPHGKALTETFTWEFTNKTEIAYGMWKFSVWHRARPIVAKEFFVMPPVRNFARGATNAAQPQWGLPDSAGMQLGTVILTNQRVVACFLHNHSFNIVKLDKGNEVLAEKSVTLWTRAVGDHTWTESHRHSRGDSQSRPNPYVGNSTFELLPRYTLTHTGLVTNTAPHTLDVRLDDFVLPEGKITEAYIEFKNPVQLKNRWSGCIDSQIFVLPVTPHD